MSQTNHPLSPELCRTFVILVKREGSVTATARELGLNEASISKRIRPLVHGSPPLLPRPWLQKRGKRFFLTDEGKTMLDSAKEQAERWQQFTSFASAARLPGLTVACGQESAGGIVLQAATAFRKRHPEAVFRIAVVRGQRRIEGVASGLYDLALVTDPPVTIREIARREVVIEEVMNDELILACSARWPWIAKFSSTMKAVGFRDLSDWPLLLPERDSAVRKQWDERIRRHEYEIAPQVAIEVGGWRVLLGYVLAGFGVGLLPRSVAEEARTKLVTRPLIDQLRPANCLRLVQLAGGESNPLLLDFASELKNRRNSPW